MSINRIGGALGRRLVTLILSVLEGREIENIETDAGVSSEDGVPSVDVGQGERKETARGSSDLGEIR